MHITYCRKSTDSEDRQVLSLDAQKDENFKLAERDGVDVQLIKTYVESRSAKDPGRPIFNQMLKELEKAQGSIIYCWKLNRLARNMVDGGQIIWLMDRGCITEIKTHGQNFTNTPFDKFMMSLQFSQAKIMVDELAIDVKRGLEKKLNLGGWPGRTPAGYLNDPTGLKGQKKVFVDPVKSSYVIKLFSLFSSGGFSLKDIVKILYSDGFRTRQGGKVHASVLYRMLNNPFYMGLMIRGGKHYEGNHEPLVSKELYDQCQNVFNGNRSSKQKHLFPLRGFITCPDCGCMVTASLQKGHQYYHCTNGKGLHNGKREYFKSEVLNTEVAKKFQDLQFDEELIEIMYQAAKAKDNSALSFMETAKARIVNQLNSLTQKRERIEDAFIDGQLSKDRYEARILDLNNQEADMKTQAKHMERQISLEGQDTIEQTKKAFLTARYAEKDFLCGDDLQKHELTKILLSNLTVKNQKVQQIQFKPVYQRMYLSPKKLDFVAWSG
jgi:site-specific DNA recombinase